MFLKGQIIKDPLPWPGVRFLLFFLLLICFLLITTVLLKGELSFLYPFIVKSFSILCHQDHIKTFTVGNIHMLVCARCTGIYSGALLASLIVLTGIKIKQPPLKYLYLAVVPVVLDVISCNLLFYAYLKTAALFTGMVLGAVLFIFVLNVIENYRNNE